MTIIPKEIEKKILINLKETRRGHSIYKTSGTEDLEEGGVIL
jgi:hypothetical protein